MVHVWERLGRRRGLYCLEIRELELGPACAFCGETCLKRTSKLFLLSWSIRVSWYFLSLSNERNLLLIVVSASQAESPAIFWYTFAGQNVCPVLYKSGASCLSDKASVFKVPHSVLNASEEGVLYFKYL